MPSDLILLLIVVVVALSVRARPGPAIRLAAPGEPGRGAIPSGAEVRRMHRSVRRWIEPSSAAWMAPRGVPANLARAPRPVRIVAASDAVSA